MLPTGAQLGFHTTSISSFSVATLSTGWLCGCNAQCCGGTAVGSAAVAVRCRGKNRCCVMQLADGQTRFIDGMMSVCVQSGFNVVPGYLHHYC